MNKKLQNIVCVTIAAITVSIAIALVVVPEVRFNRLVKNNAVELHALRKYESESINPLIERIMDEAEADIHDLRMDAIHYSHYYDSYTFDSRKNNIVRNTRSNIRDVAEPFTIVFKEAIDKAVADMAEYESHGVPDRRLEDTNDCKSIIERSIELLNTMYELMGVDKKYETLAYNQ